MATRKPGARGAGGQGVAGHGSGSAAARRHVRAPFGAPGRRRSRRSDLDWDAGACARCRTCLRHAGANGKAGGTGPRNDQVHLGRGAALRLLQVGQCHICGPRRHWPYVVAHAGAGQSLFHAWRGVQGCRGASPAGARAVTAKCPRNRPAKPQRRRGPGPRGASLLAQHFPISCGAYECTCAITDGISRAPRSNGLL